MLRQDRMFLCNELFCKFVEAGHFQLDPVKQCKIKWCGWALRCILFGVVVELGTPRISDPTAFVAWHRCQCIDPRVSFAAEWVGPRCWAGLTNIAWECSTYLDILYRQRPRPWLMSPKLVLCESTDWHHQRRNPIQVMMMQEHNDCRDLTIVAWSFAGYQCTHPQRACSWTR